MKQTKKQKKNKRKTPNTLLASTPTCPCEPYSYAVKASWELYIIECVFIIVFAHGMSLYFPNKQYRTLSFTFLLKHCLTTLATAQEQLDLSSWQQKALIIHVPCPGFPSKSGNLNWQLSNYKVSSLTFRGLHQFLWDFVPLVILSTRQGPKSSLFVQKIGPSSSQIGI